MVEEASLVHRWDPPLPLGRVELDDETLRDGLQSPTWREPELEGKKRYLHLLAGLGVAAVDLGMPAAGARMAEEVEQLLAEIGSARLPLAANCAVRAKEADVTTCANISQRVGLGLELMLFLPFSRLRRAVEGWQVDELLRKLARVVSWARSQGLSVTFVAEDASRTSPEDLQQALLTAARAGAGRVCLADTTGVLSPWGAEQLVRFSRTVLDEHGFTSVGLDWHGHNDRGLAVACALAAARGGADRLHATLLGVGERAGNPPLEQMLVNLALLGAHAHPVNQLVPRLREAARVLGLPVPAQVPILGEAVFCTATGVHAAAIFKAQAQGRHDWEELVYNPFPPSFVGAQQTVRIGPYSGAASVRFWLREHGLPENARLVQAVLEMAKASRHVLDDEDILATIGRLS